VIELRQIFCIILILVIIGPTLLTTSELTIPENSELIDSETSFQKYEPAGHTQVTRDVEFTMSKSFDVSNMDEPSDVAERYASDIVEEIDSFVPEGVSKVEDVDVYYTDVSLDITQIYIVEDRDIIPLNPGEVYLKIVLNRYYEYIYDNDGLFYVGDDGTYVDTDISLDTSLYSMDGCISIEIYGYESDFGFDQDMGGELFYVSLIGKSNYELSGWNALNDYAPIGGSETVQLWVNIDLQLTNIDVASYPDDWATTTGDASYLIAATYMPKLYYDLGDFGHIPGIEKIYHQVYYGYDPSIGSNSYVIYYMFYYEYETDNFGALFGHYYDFEPLLLFVQNIGDEPYRIVYRDVGTDTLPPEVIIEDYYLSTATGSIVADVSTPLLPILGEECTVNYERRSSYWSTPSYRFETDQGLTPFMEVPIFSITNTYHQMELGQVFLSIEVDLTPIQSYLAPFDDNTIRWGYSLLDESFASDINVYEGVNLWNGADYQVPENISLTFDMLWNPYEFPYIVDCYEEVVHYVEEKQNHKSNGFYYDIDLELQFVVPATVTLGVPTTIRKGETYDVSIGMELDASEIVVRFLYDINLGFTFDWWFFEIEENATYDGVVEFVLDLETISDTLSSLGIGDETFLDSYIGDWVTLSKFDTSTDLLGTLLDATIEIHLLQILSDTIGAEPTVAQILKILRFVIDEVDLIACPSISGSVTTDISVANAAITLDQNELTFDEGETQKTVQMTAVGGASTTSISLDNMQYHTLFATDWSLELNFTDTMNNFVDDQMYDIGRFPEITFSSDEHSIGASIATNYKTPVEIAVVNDITSPVLDVSRDVESPTDGDAVDILVSITDESPISQVLLSHSIDSGHTWINTSMSESVERWIATIPEHDADTTVEYKIFAVDSFSNWAVSDTYSYTVQEQPSTTTTDLTITTTTTDSTSSNPTDPTQSQNLLVSTPMLVALIGSIGGVLVVLVVVAIIKKR